MTSEWSRDGAMRTLYSGKCKWPSRYCGFALGVLVGVGRGGMTASKSSQSAVAAPAWSRLRERPPASPGCNRSRCMQQCATSFGIITTGSVELRKSLQAAIQGKISLFNPFSSIKMGNAVAHLTQTLPPQRSQHMTRVMGTCRTLYCLLFKPLSACSFRAFSWVHSCKVGIEEKNSSSSAQKTVPRHTLICWLLGWAN